MVTHQSESMKQQRGLTLISWVIVIAFLAFQGVLAIRIIPVYISDNSVRNVMKSLETDSDMKQATAKRIKSSLIKKLKINNIYDITNENITVKKGKRGTTVTLVYEPRGTVIANLEYIVKFEHEAVIP